MRPRRLSKYVHVEDSLSQTLQCDASSLSGRFLMRNNQVERVKNKHL
jgi:hypothetical protein